MVRRLSGLRLVTVLLGISGVAVLPAEARGRGVERKIPGVFEDHTCPFDVREIPVAELGERLDALERGLRLPCAVDAIYQTSPSVRQVGADRLGRSGASTDLLRDLDLEAVGPDDVAAEIVRRAIPLLEARDDQTRYTGAFVLSVLQHPTAVPALSRLSLSADADARRWAVEGLAEMRDAAALEPLVRVARGPNVEHGLIAVRGISEIGSPAARDALMDIMGSWRVPRNLRYAAAVSLRKTGDPAAKAAADSYLARFQPQWQRVFYCAGVLYFLAFMASRPGNRRWWARAFYAAVVASVVVAIDPAWVIMGRHSTLFWRLAVGYPIGLGLGVIPISLCLRWMGHRESARGMEERILRAVFLSWATMVLWVPLLFVLLIVGIALSWT